MALSVAQLYLALVPVRKALDPNDAGDYIRILDQLARATKGLAQPAEARALREALDVLDVDWKKLSASQRDKIVDAARAAIAKPANSVAQKISAELSHRAIDIATGTKASNEKRYKWGIETSLSAVDKQVLETAAKSQVNYIRDEFGRRSDKLSAKAREIVSRGLENGLGTNEIGAKLREELTEANRSDAYWNMISSVFANRARTYANLSSYRDAGITRFRFEAVMDERTSQGCRFLHGRTFEVKNALATMEKDDVAAQPWVVEGKDEEGNPILYYKEPDGSRRTVATIAQRTQGVDAKGKFTGGMSDSALAAAGIMLPPLHANCRSTILPEDDLDDEIGAQPPPPPPPPPPPKKPQPRPKPQPQPPPPPPPKPEEPKPYDPAPYGRDAQGRPLGFQFPVPKGNVYLERPVERLNAIPAPFAVGVENGASVFAVKPGMEDQVPLGYLDIKPASMAGGKKPVLPYADGLKQLGKTLDQLVAELRAQPTPNISVLALSKLRVPVPRGQELTASRQGIRDALDISTDPKRGSAEKTPVVIKHGGKFFVPTDIPGNVELLAAGKLQVSGNKLRVNVIDLDAKIAENAAAEAERARPKVKTPDQLYKAVQDSTADYDKAREAKDPVAKAKAAAVLRGAIRDYVGAAIPGSVSQDAKYKRSERDHFDVWSQGRIGANVAAHHNWQGGMVFSESYYQQFVRANAAGNRKQDAMRVLIHEELHGYSPITSWAYQGAGVGIEEAQTEILARKLYRQSLGQMDQSDSYAVSYRLPKVARDANGNVRIASQGSDGSYGGFINAVFIGTAQHAPSIPLDKLAPRIEKAFEDVLRHPRQIQSAEEHIDVFVDNLGVSEDEAKALKAHLKSKKGGMFK